MPPLMGCMTTGGHTARHVGVHEASPGRGLIGTRLVRIERARGRGGAGRGAAGAGGRPASQRIIRPDEPSFPSKTPRMGRGPTAVQHGRCGRG